MSTPMTHHMHTDPERGGYRYLLPSIILCISSRGINLSHWCVFSGTNRRMYSATPIPKTNDWMVLLKVVRKSEPPGFTGFRQSRKKASGLFTCSMTSDRITQSKRFRFPSSAEKSSIVPH